MHFDLRPTSWPLLGALTLLSLGGCDDGTGPSNGLTASQVAGIYAVCELRFVPEGAQPEVNIATAALEADQTRLGIDVSPRSFEITYVPKGNFTDRELPGDYELGSGSITLHLTGSSADRDPLLLPERLSLTYQASPRQLSAAGSTTYEVPRADYTRLAGIPPTGLAERIPGRLHARFGSPNCG